VTKAEEQNMWKRLVALEEAVTKLRDAPRKLLTNPSSSSAPREGEIISGTGEPPRDRYGAEVGRPGM
jgi:hypothetical protein